MEAVTGDLTLQSLSLKVKGRQGGTQKKREKATFFLPGPEEGKYFVYQVI